MKFWLIIFINFHFGYGNLPGPIGKILETAWNELNPNSMKNQITSIYHDLSKIKTHLDKIEQAVVFARDINNIEHLIETYEKVTSSSESKSAAEKWAKTALEYGSDGFLKTLNSLKTLMDGTSNLFADGGSIFDTIAKK